MAEDSAEVPNSADLIKAVERIAAQPPKPPQLGPDAQTVYDESNRNMEKIFEFTLNRINAARHGLDELEAALRSKSRSVTESLAAYVAAVEVIERQTQEMQTAIGEVIVAQDAVS